MNRYIFNRKLHSNIFVYWDKILHKKVIKKTFMSSNDLEREQSIHSYFKTLNVESLNKNNIYLQNYIESIDNSLIFDYVFGHDLQQYIQKLNRKPNTKQDHNNQQSNTNETIMHQMGYCIDWFQKRNLIHLDIKPENFIYDHKTKQICCIDLYSVHKLYDELTFKNVRHGRFGTNTYLSPEMKYENIVHKNTDLWSLGITGFVLSEGYNPYQVHGVNINNVQEYSYQVLKNKNVVYAKKIFDLLHYSPDHRKNHFK